MWERHPDGRRELFAEDIIRKLTKLESQRNAAWKTIKDIRDSVIADETFGDTVELLFGKPLEEAEAEIARLNSLLNAPVDLPDTAAQDSASKSNSPAVSG